MPGWPAPETILRRCYDSALTASDPGQHLRRALDRSNWADRPTYLLGVGKASGSMAEAALAWASASGGEFIDGLIITPEGVTVSKSRFNVIVGDHPIPHQRSLLAADALGAFIGELPQDAVVHVMLSGGASSLMAAPLPGLSQTEISEAFQLLLTSGLPIHEMNAVRKRITRWSAGRLAAALAPRSVFVWLLSDVAGDDMSTIASGPCTGDPWTTEDIADLLARHHLMPRLSPAMQNAMSVETLKPNDSVFDGVTSCVIAGNQVALGGITAEAARLGCPQRRFTTPLTGEASQAGRELAKEAMRVANEWRQQNQQLIEMGHLELVRPLLLYQGGETTVTIAGEHGQGGRSQELALAAAEMLEVSPFPVTFLAAGTDGRDGNTDAAGAMVNQNTWEMVRAGGLDPERELRQHNSHHALRAADALLTTGPTGGNVMDVVIAVVGDIRDQRSKMRDQRSTRASAVSVDL